MEFYKLNLKTINIIIIINIFFFFVIYKIRGSQWRALLYKPRQAV